MWAQFLREQRKPGASEVLFGKLPAPKEEWTSWDREPLPETVSELEKLARVEKRDPAQRSNEII